ncbi:MAG TPA: glutathione S-transferase family protein [Chloroflexota bacterium]|nr:glutathione S-transferase family protein [Chloroflexota bacterium]
MTTRQGEVSLDGAFVRQQYTFRDRITADGSSGFPAEAGRYHLYVSLACPWAHRAVIVRQLLGLENVVSLSVVDPVRDERGWEFSDEFPDPINGFRFLSEAYRRSDPSYDARYTVPTLWDMKTGRIVSNNFPDITIDLETQFKAFQRPGAPDLYPEPLRPAIDRLIEEIYEDVNDGVYRAGFAQSQEAYEYAVGRLFARLDALEEHLATRRYLLGDQITEADIRLYPTLARFDAVYHYHFKCNLRRLTDYPNLWAYARDLYSIPAFGETTNFDHIKRHYYMTHPQLNPSRIVPAGPMLDWEEPQDRARLLSGGKR